MSNGGDERDASVSVTDQPGDEPSEQGEEAKAKQKLELDVQIQDVGPCKKHLKVTIPRPEIERQFEESLGKFQRDAQVPGFRAGRAPRQLVVKRFRKQVAGQVKSSLLMASLEQLDADYQLNPIVQPKLDVEAITLPDDGPMTFEMDLEVRPEFAVAEYKNLKVKRPIKTIRDQNVEVRLGQFLERYAQIVPKLEGAARIGDYLTADLTFLKPDGSVLNEVKEIQFRLQPELRFQDGHIPGIGAALEGIKPGEAREIEAKLGSAAAEQDLRGRSVMVKIAVNDLKQVRLPEINPEFLDSIGFKNLADLRQAVQEALMRQNESQQRQTIRRQILDALIAATPFELPADLVSRQEKSTTTKLTMELRQGGFSDSDIRAREAEIRANAHEMTLRSLKEFFILARIADAEGIKVEEEDLELEIEAMAGAATRVSGESGLGSRRKGWATPSRPRSWSARRRPTFSSLSRSRTSISTRSRPPSKPWTSSPHRPCSRMPRRRMPRGSDLSS